MFSRFTAWTSISALRAYTAAHAQGVKFIEVDMRILKAGVLFGLVTLFGCSSGGDDSAKSGISGGQIPCYAE